MHDTEVSTLGAVVLAATAVALLLPGRAPATAGAAGSTPPAFFDAAVEARGSDWIDLTPDGCTMCYTSRGRYVKRYNVCTGRQVGDLNGLPDAQTDLVQIRGVRGERRWFEPDLDVDTVAFRATDSCSSNVHAWDLFTGEDLLPVNMGDPPGTAKSANIPPSRPGMPGAAGRIEGRHL